MRGAKQVLLALIFACDAYKIVFCFAKLTDKAKCVRICEPVHIYSYFAMYMYTNILKYTTYKFDLRI